MHEQFSARAPEGVLRHLRAAIELAFENVQAGGRPFGAILVRDDQVIGKGVNRIAATQDPTTHAEMEAIRLACVSLHSPKLTGAVMYASGHPCPMCLAAMHLSGIERAYYAYDQQTAQPFGLSTEALYAELKKPLLEQSMPTVCEAVRVPGLDLYAAWAARSSKT